MKRKVTKFANNVTLIEGKLFSYEEDALYGSMTPKKIMFADRQSRDPDLPQKLKSQQPKMAK